MTHKMNRRTALAAIAAVAVAGPAVAVAMNTDPVFAAIERHKAANAAFTAACDAFDPFDAEWMAAAEVTGTYTCVDPTAEDCGKTYQIKERPPQTEAYKAAEADKDRACGAEYEAAFTVADTVATTKAGLSAQIEHLLNSDYVSDVVYAPELVAALLHSVSAAVQSLI